MMDSRTRNGLTLAATAPFGGALLALMLHLIFGVRFLWWLLPVYALVVLIGVPVWVACADALDRRDAREPGPAPTP